MENLKQYTQQDLLDEAMREELIEGFLMADGWVHLYIDGHVITLTQGRLVPFLYGMLSCIRSSQGPLSCGSLARRQRYPKR